MTACKMPELKPNISVIYTNLYNKNTYDQRRKTQKMCYMKQPIKNNSKKCQVKRSIKVYRQVKTVLKQVLMALIFDRVDFKAKSIK